MRLAPGESPINRYSSRAAMANIASQKKRILRSERERSENRRLTGAVKTHFRRLESAVEAGDAETVESEHRALISKIDKAVAEGRAARQHRRAQEEPRRPPRRRLRLRATPLTVSRPRLA